MKIHNIGLLVAVIILAIVQRLIQSIQFLNENRLASKRSKYLFTLGLLAIGIGLVFKKVISYPTECSPTNQQVTYLLKI